jgi:23S rRNA (uridine2552-2'-O)-methyltransferase
VGNAGLVVAVDLLEMAPIRNVRCIRGDFTDPQLRAALIGAVGEADLVLSDSAPNITGVHEVDQARFKALLESTLDVARVVLKKGGSLLVKVFEGPEIKSFRVACEKEFGHVAVRKPAASRARSREFYILARRFRGDRAPLYL